MKKFLGLLASVVMVLFVMAGCSGGGGNGGVIIPAANNDLVTGIIGTNGGSLITPSGNTTLAVPAGALTNAVTISVAQNVTNDSLGAIQMPYQFGPSGLQFGAPATVTFTYDPASLDGLDENQLKVAYESDGQYVPIDGSVVDTVNHTVTALIAHFSDYGTVDYTAPLNTAFGDFNGVVAYSNNHCAPTLPTDQYFDKKDCHYKYSDGPPNKVFDPSTGTNSHVTGERWQCVEYVSRYYWMVYKHDILLPPLQLTSNDASNFWENIPDGAVDSRGLVQYSNGGSVAPQVGDIIVFKSNTSAHVAIARKVTNHSVYVIQQNVFLNFEDADAGMMYYAGTNYLEPLSIYPGLKVRGWLRMPSAPQAPLIGLRYNYSSPEEFGFINPSTGDFSAQGTLEDLLYGYQSVVSKNGLYTLGTDRFSQLKIYTSDISSGTLISAVNLNYPFGYNPDLAGVNSKGTLIAVRWQPDTPITGLDVGVVNPTTGDFTVTGFINGLISTSNNCIVSGDILYCLGSSNNAPLYSWRLYSQNTISGSPIGVVDVDPDVFQLAGVNHNGAVIAIRFDNSTSTWQFGSIDPLTGNFSVIGMIGDMVSFWYRPVVVDNTLYVLGSKVQTFGISTGIETLYALDTVSGSLIGVTDLVSNNFGLPIY